MKPKISIIITSYNIENYISDCLDNIINQTIEDIEIIVVDDGSKDRTPDIIREYSKRDSRIIPILNEENSVGGVATPANIGITRATGEYIGFADGDDLYDTTMFHKLYLSAETNNADIALCAYEEFEGDTDNRKSPYEPAWSNVKSLDSLEIIKPQDKKKILSLLPVPWRKLYKAELLKKNNLLFPVGPYFFEDNGFHWFTTLQATKVSFVDEILCLHRRNRVGQTMSSGGHKLLGVFHQHSVIYDFLIEKNIISDYKDYSLNWLCGHVSWIQQVLSTEFSKDFYDTVLPHFEKYSNSEVQGYLSTKYFDRKSLELIVSVLRRNPKMFVEVMHGKQSKSISEKILFNYHKLGSKQFIKMIARVINHNYSELRGNRKAAQPSNSELLDQINSLKHDIHSIHLRLSNIEMSTTNLDSELNHGILMIGNKLDDIERIVETGFLLAEKNK